MINSSFLPTLSQNENFFIYTEAWGKLPRIKSVCLSCNRQYSEKVLNAAFKKFNSKRNLYNLTIVGGYNLNNPGKRKR